MNTRNKFNLNEEIAQNNIIKKRRENNTMNYIEKLNLKCESKVINNPSEKFSLYKSNPQKQFMFSLFSELNSLEELFLSDFIKEMKRKTENEVRELFPKKKKEYEDRVKLLLQKAEKELINNKEIVTNLKHKNTELKNQIKMLKNENDITSKELKESEISIKKLNEKFELYSEFKKTYDLFCSGFNYQEKEDIENNIMDLKKEFIINKHLLDDVREELKEKKKQISELKQKMNEEEINNRNQNYKLYNEFFESEMKNKLIEDLNKKKLLTIKEDINSNILSVQENDKIQKSFISVYNLFHKNLNLERNLIKNPKNIDLIKSDYTPKTFMIEEVVNYIILMIHNSTDESCFNLLKNVISYIYMILREIGGGLNKMKYDPVKAINEIEKNMNSTLSENKSLTENIKELENKITQEYKAIRKLNKNTKNIKYIHEELQKAIKNIYFNNKKDKIIRKSFSDNNFKSNKLRELKIDKTRNKFEDINTDLEKNKNKIEEEKVPFNKESLDILINRINKLYFYRMKDKKYHEKEINRYSIVRRRMNQKFNKLKNIQKYKDNNFSVENTINSNINRNIDALITNIQNNYM